MKVSVCDSWFCHVFNSDFRSCVCMKVCVIVGFVMSLTQISGIVYV